jgi:hypothetical protein
MRFLVKVKTSLECVNQKMLDGSFSTRMQKVLSDLQPEAAYFLEEDGCRTAILVVNISEASQIPKIAEPFFHGMKAEVRLHPVMTPQDLADANFQELAKTWSGA